MSTSKSDVYSAIASSRSESDENDELSLHLSRNSQSIADDPSRSTLHTGAEREGSATTSENTRGSATETPSIADLDSDDSQEISPSDDRAEVGIDERDPNDGDGLTPEAAAPIAPEVSAPEAGERTSAQSFPIADEDVNGAPAEVPLADEAGSENTRGAATETPSTADPDSDDSQEISPSDDRAEVGIDERDLNDGDGLTPEAAAPIAPEVSAPEAGERTSAQSFPIADEDVNEAPAEVPLADEAGSENTRGAATETPSIADPDSDDSQEISPSDDRAEVWIDERDPNDGDGLNPEAAAPIAPEVSAPEVSAPEAGARTSAQSFPIADEDVNETPAEVLLADEAGSENTRGAATETPSIADPDSDDSQEISPSVDRAEVVANEIDLNDGDGLTPEAAAPIAPEVSAPEAGERTSAQSFPIADEDVNEAPSNLSLNNSLDNLIRNGSFEDFDLDYGRWKGFDADKTGAWQDQNGIEIWDNLGRVKASDGDQLMELDHGLGVDSISQVIETEAGQVYDLGLDIRERISGGTDTVEVYWNDDLVTEINPQSSAWETFELKVVGTGEDTLELRESEAESDSLGALIDNITLVAAERTIAENVEGAVIGELSFDDADERESHEFTVSDDRFEVVENTLRLKSGVSLDYEEASEVQVEVTVTDAGGLATSETFTIHVADGHEAEIVPVEIPVKSGFQTKYFDVDHSLRKLDDVDWSAPPTHLEVKSDINFENSANSFWEEGSKDTFGVEVSGSIEVEEGGTFEFFLGGDDGAMLFVDGQPVVDNDGLHAYATGSGEITLEPGTHHIEVRYFENYGHAGLKLEWEGPGIEGRELVTAPDIAQAQTVGGMPLALDVNMSELDAGGDTEVSLEGLPEGTIIEAGSATITVDGSGGADLSGWAGDTLLITPPVDFTGAVSADLVVENPLADGSIQRGHQNIQFEVNEAQAEAPSAELVGGFHASYFDVDHSLRRLDDVDWSSEPTHDEMVSEINYKNSSDSFWEGGSKDTFGAKLEGKVTIDEGGDYTFFASGDDGVALFIDGKAVIDNDGLHAYSTGSAEVSLEPGTYDIEVRYFENYGHAGLKLEWNGPDTNGRETLQADAPEQIPENGTLDLGISLDGASEDASVFIDGLPANTLLVCGDEAALSDGTAIDLSGWDINHLEISPPPGFEGTIEGALQVSDTAFNGADISSTSSFTLQVGAPSDVGPEEGAEVLEIQSALEARDSSAKEGWDGDLSDADPDSNEGGDVMAEPVLSNINAEISVIDTDTYERVDW